MLNTQPKIFISSTIHDLKNERKAALKAVEEVGGLPLMSEFTMPAVSSNSVTACLERVKQADIYVLVIGTRYGWRPEGKESITEMEYNTAIDNGISVLAFNTPEDKEELQRAFEKRVESAYFRKTIADAFDLQTEMVKSLKEEIDKLKTKLYSQKEWIYSNLVKTEIPDTLYRAELDIDKKEIAAFNKKRGFSFKRKPSLQNYAISALAMKGISFPHDWVVYDKAIYTFHDLQDPDLPLGGIIDHGSVERFSAQEFYESNEDQLSKFKFLLKMCFETMVHKKGIKWIWEEGLFAFIPVQKDKEDNWKDRRVTWTKGRKESTRQVVWASKDRKDDSKIFNLKCLAFRSKFEHLDGQWYVSIKPDWTYLWPDLRYCRFGFKSIQNLKKMERNQKVYNDFLFILKYLQPSESESIFTQYGDYKFLSLGQVEQFNFSPIIPDKEWLSLESPQERKKLESRKDGLFL